MNSNALEIYSRPGKDDDSGPVSASSDGFIYGAKLLAYSYCECLGRVLGLQRSTEICSIPPVQQQHEIKNGRPLSFVAPPRLLTGLNFDCIGPFEYVEGV